MSPISSRYRVVSLARSKMPMNRELAPVKAPFSWPKSSLSSRESGKAALLMVTILRGARAEQLWMRLASSSLPVPFSPRIRTEILVAASFLAFSQTARTSSLRVTMLPESSLIRSRRVEFSSSSSPSLMAFSTILSSLLKSSGFCT